jgi:hypothetical protein
MTSTPRILGIIAFGFGVPQAYGAPIFFGTTHADSAYLNWQVATNRAGSADGPNVNGDYASFPVNGNFSTAMACTNIPVAFFGGGSPVRPDWIANESDCSSGTNTQQWTHYIFKQSFLLDPLEAARLELKFQWAADDSGQVFAARGAWVPRWSLNSLAQADLVTGIWPRGDSYSLGPTVSVSGFQEGINTVYFWVQGNGITDGMMLKNAEFSIKALPEPEALAPLGFGVLGAVVARRRAALRTMTHPEPDHQG